MKRTLSFFAALLGATASTAFAHGDLHEAIAAVSHAIEASPSEAALFLRRAELHRMHGNWPVAVADYARARKLQPDLGAVEFGLAQMHLAQGREKAALQRLNVFLARFPRYTAARVVRAGIFGKRGDWRAADADLAAAVESSTEPHYATMRAELLERHGQMDAAIRCLDEASRARGRVPVLEQQALAIEERSGRADAALRRVDDLISKEPRRDIWLERKARLLAKTGRDTEARKVWAEAAAEFEKVPAEKRAARNNRELAARIEAGLAAGKRGAK